jgi:hypothetical protein
MKTPLQFMKYLTAVLLLASMNLYAQEYHYQQGFMENGTPDGWTVQDVSYSSSSSNTANTEDTAAHYCAKMKTNNLVSWLQAPRVNGAGTFSFWCKVKDTSIDPHVTIQTSPDGETWTDFAVDTFVDLGDDSTFQRVVLDINMSGPVSIRIYVTSAIAGETGPGTLTVDDIHLTKPTPAADDVTLGDLTVGGVLVPGFDFEITSYEMTIPVNGGYEVAAIPNNPNATVSIQQIESITGSEEQRTATVTVTGEDGTSTATTTIIITRSEYFFQEGFGILNVGSFPLPGWFADHIYISPNDVPAGAQHLYPAESAMKFTGGHETGSITDPGILRTPKLANVGTLRFWVALQKQIGGESLTVKMKKGFAAPVEIWKADDTQLTVEWQEVVLEINETDSLEIEWVAICDVNDDPENRIWIDDISLTGITTSVPSLKAGPTVSLYPNPANDLLHIQAPADAYQMVRVYNITGQKMLEEMLESGQSSIPVDQLPKGIYLISFSGEAGKSASKFIKE